MPDETQRGTCRARQYDRYCSIRQLLPYEEETPEAGHPPPAPTSVKSTPGPPATLGSSAAAQVRFIVWCKDCGHQVEPDPGEMAEQYGTATTVLDWCARLVCSHCGSRQI